MKESNIGKALKLIQKRDSLVKQWSVFNNYLVNSPRGLDFPMVLVLTPKEEQVKTEHCTIEVLVSKAAFDALLTANSAEVDRLNKQLKDLGVTTVDEEYKV